MPTKPTELRTVDIVIPVFNEAPGLKAFHQSLTKVLQGLPQDFHLIYVDDGSTDGTDRVLTELAGSITLITLSRNFGHQAALTAGMDHSAGDALICMDGDGQHPPEMIPEILAQAAAGFDIVLLEHGQQPGGRWKNLSSKLFYWLINRFSGTSIPVAASDFRLITRPVREALTGLREYHRFLRGMVAWLGFTTTVLHYQPLDRIAGESKYSLGKMLRLAMDAFFSFSLRPLYFMIGIGGLFLVLALVEIAYVLSFWLRGLGASLAPGWSSLMFVILCVGGTTMVSLGIVGIYIGNIMQEVKGRPVYVIRSIQTAGGDKSRRAK